MRIVFVHTDFRVYWLPRLACLNAFLSQHGHELHIVEIAGKGSPYAFSAKHANAAEGKQMHWECLFPDAEMTQLNGRLVRKEVFRRLGELRPDIVFSGAIAYPSGANAVAWGEKTGVPIVIFDNARLADVPRSWLVNFVKRRIYSHVSAMLIPAPSHLTDYRFWGIPEEKVYYGLNVIDNDYWRSLSRSELAFSELRNTPYILGVGRQVAKKNWLSVVKAYHKAGLQARLVLVGDGPERVKIETLRKELDLEEKVILLDFQPPEKLAPLYANASLLLLVSTYGETWGLTVNEAMACGTPVMVSRECGCCETLCIDGETGWRTGTDEESIANALRTFAAVSQEQLKVIRENVRSLIDQWGCERFCASVLKISEHFGNRQPSNRKSIMDKMIFTTWTGGYHPT